MKRLRFYAEERDYLHLFTINWLKGGPNSVVVRSQRFVSTKYPLPARSNLTKNLFHVDALLNAIGPDILGIYSPLSISQADLVNFMRKI
ncbi:hypothetical protein [Argonema galeatum]|uniref:hypothetical protein n=1 Tax=Argonema galeatum TaxID=2942762 RepID=UPI002011D51A|nr:hypothetical protein [Argonema galeatum]MCL1463667.1 hypothetical protein [Argonema galeatum A003/A1]